MTTPATLNLEEVQGDDWLITCTFIDASGYAIDLSASTFTCQIRRGKTRNSPLAASFSIDTTDAATGIVVLSLSSAESALLTGRYYYYDLQQIDSDGKYTTLLGGKITLIKEVTTDA